MSLQQKQVTFGIILPYVWAVVFACLIMVGFVSRRISSFIDTESLILLTFIFSPVIYASAIIFSGFTMLKSGVSRNVIYAIIFNIALFSIWFIIRRSFYIELNIIS